MGADGTRSLLPVEQSPEIEDNPAERDSAQQSAHRTDRGVKTHPRADRSRAAEGRQENADHTAVQKSDSIVPAVQIDVRVEVFEEIAQKEGQKQENESQGGNDQKHSENTETEDEYEHSAYLRPNSPGARRLRARETSLLVYRSKVHALTSDAYPG